MENKNEGATMETIGNTKLKTLGTRTIFNLKARWSISDNGN